MTIGERIRQLRTARGLTQAQLAQRAGGCLAGKHIGTYEVGRRHRPRIDTLHRIARGLDVSLSELLEGVDIA